jgi:hypothetical protein
MAGQVQRGSRGHGRSSRRGSSSPQGVAVSAAGPALATTATSSTVATERSATPPQAPRVAYRLLLMKGMSPAEAANLTAYACGLPTEDLNWSLKQVNQMLFLRAMHRAGRFDGIDGDRLRPD